MYILAVDDERPALRMLERAILEAVPGCMLTSFSSTEDALAHAKKNPVDVAFLDIKMPCLNGVSLAGEIKQAHPKVNIIFITGHKDYALDAFALHASGFLQKPVSSAAVASEMANLRFSASASGVKRAHIKTFGNFDIFIDNIPIVFKRSKAKEILAYLVDRNGATVTNKELANILWGETEYSRSVQKHLQILITELLRALQEKGAGDIILRQRNSLSVVVANVDCDYYDFLDGSAAAMNAFRGEYMANYSWGEMTAGELMEQKRISGHSGK